MNEHLKGGLFIMTSMLLFAFIGPFVRWVNIPNTVFLFYTGLGGFVILIGVVLFKKGIKELWPKKYKWLFVLTSIFIAISLFTYFEAFKRTTVANTVLPHYTAPIFAAFFAALFLREKIDSTTIVSLIMSFSGVYLIFFQTGFSLKSTDTIGVILALISGIFYGINIICNKKLMTMFKPLSVMVYQYGAFILWAPLIKMNEYLIPQRAFMLTVVYILFISLLPAFIYLSGLKHVKGQHIGIIAYVEVLAVIVYGYLFFNEVPSKLTLVGGTLILISGYMVLRAEAKRR